MFTLEHVREKTVSVFLPSAPWWAWALRHAAWTYNRFHVRADTRTTPYSQTRLKVYTQPVLPFGELILAQRPGAHLQESQTQFVYGCWLGRDSHTDEHTVGSKAGVFRTRLVRRSTEDRSWSAEAIADMEWTPWRTADTTRGRPPKAAVTMNEPIWNAPLPTIPSAYREPTSETCRSGVESRIRRHDSLGETCLCCARKVTSATGGGEFWETTTSGRSRAA